MKKIILSDEDFDTLLDELRQLYGYHWNDDHIHANDCGSKVLGIIEANVEDVTEKNTTTEHWHEDFELEDRRQTSQGTKAEEEIATLATERIQSAEPSGTGEAE